MTRMKSGDVFADTKLDDGLYSLVDKKETNDEKDLVKSIAALATSHSKLLRDTPRCTRRLTLSGIRC